MDDLEKLGWVFFILTMGFCIIGLWMYLGEKELQKIEKDEKEKRENIKRIPPNGEHRFK
jgi:hypothetical protein